MNNSKEQKSNSAQNTLAIITKKQYEIGNHIVDLTTEIDYSVNNAKIYIEADFDNIMIETNKKLNELNFDTSIVVENCTSMQAFQLFDVPSVGCLNFASAKNAGGGFINGAKAQEESLSRASALYPTQMKFLDDMYLYNRSRKTYLYSYRMIFSPQVPFFKDDNEQLLSKPYCIDVITSPAVNVGAILNNKPSEKNDIESVMLERIDKILALFLVNGVENLILGAWGCGVFRNDPKDIARYFAHYFKSGGKYEKAFKKIVFAVYDTSKAGDNIKAFRDTF